MCLSVIRTNSRKRSKICPYFLVADMAQLLCNRIQNSVAQDATAAMACK